MRLEIVWMFGHLRWQRQVPRHLVAFGLVPKTQVRPAPVPMALKTNSCLDTSNQGLLVGLPHLSQLLLVLSQFPWGHPWLHRVACIWWCPGRGLDKAVWCPQEPSRPTSVLYLRFVRACTIVPEFYSTPLCISLHSYHIHCFVFLLAIVLVWCDVVRYLLRFVLSSVSHQNVPNNSEKAPWSDKQDITRWPYWRMLCCLLPVLTSSARAYKRASTFWTKAVNPRQWAAALNKI